MVTAYLDFAKPHAEVARNNAGGVSYAITPWQQLQRFLILGSAGGTYYVGERDLTQVNVDALKSCLEEDAARVVSTIVDVSLQGRAPSNEPAIFALAYASISPEERVRKLAYDALTDVCRIGTHVLHFEKYRVALGGSRMPQGLEKAVTRWFQSFDPQKLAYQAVKYPSRDGYSLRDLLRMARPVPARGTPETHLYKYIVKGGDALDDVIFTEYASDDWYEFLLAVETIKAAWKELATSQITDWISAYRIPREALPTELLNDPRIWEALLADMPLGAMVRNLGKMSSAGNLDLGSWGEGQVIHALGDAQKIKHARLHPMAILTALKVYEAGKGVKGSLTWSPNKRIINALDEAFYLAFGAVEPTNQRIRLALDVSGSMGAPVGGSSAARRTIRGWPRRVLSCREASAAMALITMATEKKADVVAYSDHMRELPIRPSMRLDEVLRITSQIPFGGTICSLPFLDAAQSGAWDIDAFVTYTDSETMDGYSGWTSYFTSSAYGPRSRDRITIPRVQEALQGYRANANLPTKSAIVAMAATPFSIADPCDAGQLDVVGFDTSTPQVLADFMRGDLALTY